MYTTCMGVFAYNVFKLLYSGFLSRLQNTANKKQQHNFLQFNGDVKMKSTLEYIASVNNIMWVFEFLSLYKCLVLWMPMKKYILALVYMAIMFIMLFEAQQLKRSCSVQRSWECEGQICNLHCTMSRCSSRALTS